MKLFRPPHLLAAAVAGIVFAAPAQAATTSSTSSNWAGYAIHGTTARFRSVSGSWVQPQVTCEQARHRRYSAYWIGLGGFRRSSTGLEQIGTEANCGSTGALRYGAWYEMIPAASHAIPMRVRPGDRMTSSVRVHGTLVHFRLTNLTRGTTFNKTFEAGHIDTTSAEWIVEATSLCSGGGSCHTQELANFGTASFDSATATTQGGHRASITDPLFSTTRLSLLSSIRSSGVEAARPFPQVATPAAATPGPVAASGTSFTVTYTPAIAVPPGAPGPGTLR